MSVPLAKIGDLCEQIRGVTYGKEDSIKEAKEKYLPILRANNITESGIYLNDFVYIPSSLVKEKQKIRKNDILIAASSGSIDVVGKAASALEDFQGGFGAFCKVLRPNNKVDPRYFANFFQTKKYRKTISSLAAGANINNLKAEHIDNLLIPLPSIDEQRRIAAILDKTDALRAKRREAIAKLDQLLQSVFLEMFGDPVSNPKNFLVRNLRDFYFDAKEGTRCGPFGSALKKSDITEDGVPLWNMDNISLNGEMTMPFSAYVSSDKANDLKSYCVEDGDILISRAGTVGKMCVVRGINKKSLITTNLIRLRFNEDLIPEFFIYLMIYNKGKIGRLQVGPDGAFTHMSTGILDSISFPYPPLSLQEKWVNIRNSIISKKNIFLDQLKSIEKFQQALSIDLFK